MGILSSAIETQISIPDFFRDLRYRRDFARSHPDYFSPDGLVIFCGGQGAGKTLSAVRYIDRVCKRFPNCLLVSNISLDLPHYLRDIIPYTGINDAAELDNGYDGILLFIDEIQTEFSSLESAKIHPSVLSKICQQRKRRMHIVGTSQLFKRLAKPFREQVNVVVDCDYFLHLIQRNRLVDFGTIAEDANGNLTAYEYKESHYFFRSPALYQMYDTYEKVNRKGGGL